MYGGRGWPSRLPSARHYVPREIECTVCAKKRLHDIRDLQNLLEAWSGPMGNSELLFSSGVIRSGPVQPVSGQWYVTNVSYLSHLPSFPGTVQVR